VRVRHKLGRGRRVVSVAAARHMGLVTLAPLRASILEPDLDARLRQVDLHGQLLARKHVRIVGALEGPLQLLQLERRERGPVAALLARSRRSTTATRTAIHHVVALLLVDVGAGSVRELILIIVRLVVTVVLLHFVVVTVVVVLDAGCQGWVITKFSKENDYDLNVMKSKIE